MGFHSDVNIVGVDNGEVILGGTSAEVSTEALLPGQSRQVSFTAGTGQVVIQASVLRPDQPVDNVDSEPGQDKAKTTGSAGHGQTTTHTHLVPYLFVESVVELLDSGRPAPDGSPGVVASFPIAKGEHPGVNGPFLFFVHDIADARIPREFIGRVTNRGSVAARAVLRASFTARRRPIHTVAVPVQTLNHAYQLILEALTVRARIDGNKITVSFGQELRDFFQGAVPELPPQSTGDLDGTGALTHFALHVSRGQDLIDVAETRFQNGDTSDDDRVAWRRSFDHIGPDWPVIRADINTTDINYDYEPWWWIDSFDLGTLQNVTAGLYLVFEPDAAFSDAALLIGPGARATGVVPDAAAALDTLGIIPGQLPDVLELLARDALRSYSFQLTQFAGRYLGEALVRLCHPDAIFLDVSAQSGTWNVRFFTLIDAAPGDEHGPLGDGTLGTFMTGGGAAGIPASTSSGTASGSAGLGAVFTQAADPASGHTATGSSPAGNAPASLPPAGPAGLGALPAGFVVVSPQTVPRLDNIETIVVVMMENRSFDHMLGYLRQLRSSSDGSGYEGFTGQEVNEVRNVSPGFRMLPATRANIPGSVTAIPSCPEHGFSRVKNQVADGAMSGFAQDYEDRYPDDGIGQWVMTFYTDRELPIYYDLAAKYAVCDHWFAAHPGATWPNRWITMSGGTPYLENPAVTDPKIGFLPEATVFDLLTQRGIDWRVFESDLSLIRTFANYRLDAERVVPYRNYDDESRSFATVASNGLLPPVVFVEPNFSDVPPLSTANDDLTPVDLAKGQDFVNEVYWHLQRSPQWPNTLMLITYDEHGGFYDHVPPPGTALGPPESIGKIPRVHPDGAEHLGVRVPAILASPWVTPGSVCKQVFDHTTIIKSILLRHRAKLQSTDFTKFGARVNQAAHLGIALSPIPYAADPTPLASPRRTQLRRAGRPAPAQDLGKPDAPAGGLPEDLYRSFLPN